MKKILLISLIFILISCSQINTSKIKYVQINEINIPVELAVTNEEKAIGLMDRINLTGGMLFVYDNEQQRQFWMKDTLIPLDMIFIGNDNKITKIHHAVPCTTLQCAIYPGNAKYVLEVNYNFTTENKISEGMKVSLVK